MMDHIYLVLVWGIYFFLHSYLASTRVKELVRRRWPRLTRFYRLAYVAVSTIGLAAIGFLLTHIPNRFHFAYSPTLQVAGFTLLLIGVALIVISFRQYSFAGFIGLRNDAHDTLRTSGFLNYIRHPIYAGTILMVLGYLALSPKSTVMISALCIFSYLPIGIYLEEKKLIALYGEVYRDYRRRVPAVFPKLPISGFLVLLALL